MPSGVEKHAVVIACPGIGGSCQTWLNPTSFRRYGLCDGTVGAIAADRVLALALATIANPTTTTAAIPPPIHNSQLPTLDEPKFVRRRFAMFYLVVMKYAPTPATIAFNATRAQPPPRGNSPGMTWTGSGVITAGPLATEGLITGAIEVAPVVTTRLVRSAAWAATSDNAKFTPSARLTAVAVSGPNTPSTTRPAPFVLSACCSAVACGCL